MPSPKTWLVDFDETLASGSLTKAFQYSFPKFVLENQLVYDVTHLQEAMLTLQERARQNPDTELLLGILFEMMGWPMDLRHQFLRDIQTNSHPILFEDTVPFLEKLRANKQNIYIVSNNKYTPAHVRSLDLEKYISGVFTPYICPDTQPKPHSSLWEYILTRESDIDPLKSIVIGDDPWSDGAFAERCGLQCWIIDRMNRFSHMYNQKSYRWTQSLLQVSV